MLLVLWGHWDGFGKRTEKNKLQYPSPSIILGHSVTEWLSCGYCSQRGHSPVRGIPAYFPGMMSQEPWQRLEQGAWEGETSGSLHGVGVMWEEGWDSNRQVGGHLQEKNSPLNMGLSTNGERIWVGAWVRAPGRIYQEMRLGKWSVRS